jgi:membrane peptidoglycan carboxypeptidase
MGPGIYGVTRASREYFNTTPGKLDPLQAVHLAALTPNPRILSRQLRDGRPSPAWMRRLNLLLRLMRVHGYLREGEQQRFRALRLSFAKSAHLRPVPVSAGQL